MKTKCFRCGAPTYWLFGFCTVCMIDNKLAKMNDQLDRFAELDRLRKEHDCRLNCTCEKGVN